MYSSVIREPHGFGAAPAYPVGETYTFVGPRSGFEFPGYPVVKPSAPEYDDIDEYYFGPRPAQKPAPRPGGYGGYAPSATRPAAPQRPGLPARRRDEEPMPEPSAFEIPPLTGGRDEQSDEETPAGPGYKSPYTGRYIKAPVIPNSRNTNPTAYIAHMASFWRESGSGHPMTSKKRDRRVNSILAMYQELQQQTSRPSRGLGSLLASYTSFFQMLLSPAYPTSATPPLLPPGPVKEWTPITGKRRALLVGINYVGQQGQLRGCANDVKEMESFLQRRGFTDFQRLIDDGTNSTLPPTKENILNALQWLVRDARPGDSLFFHYSGHGSSQPDTSGDEADNKDETIVPLDFRKAGMIVDDTLNEKLCMPLPAGCRLTAVMDCCHSGTGLDLPYMKSAQGPGLQCEYKDNRLQGDVLLVSGCRDEQTSADVVQGDIGYGAMTNSMLTSLRENSNLSYNQLLDTMCDRLKRARYTQVPQLSMSRNLNLDTQFAV